MVALDKALDLNNAMFVSLNLLKNVICLDFCKDLDHSLLEPSTSHQGSVVRGCEPLLSNFDFLYWLHPVPYLIVDLVHEIADSVSNRNSSLVG